MFAGILRLGWVDLRSKWLSAIAALVLIGMSIVGLAYFQGQARRTQALIEETYEEQGAATFLIELSGISDRELEETVVELRGLAEIKSAEAPYNGVETGLQADVSFLVFANAQQKEYLGAHTVVLGVDSGFPLRTGYQVNFRWINRNSPTSILGIPLLPVEGEFRPPRADEILLPVTVTDYIGVQPGARGTVELGYFGVNPSIVRTFDNFRLAGIFDIAGPDRGRIDPFWQLSYVAEPLLTARGTGGTEPTTVPVVMNEAIVQDFLRTVDSELRARHASSGSVPIRSEIVVTAKSVASVRACQNRVASFLASRGLKADSETRQAEDRSYRILLPERNNFVTAQREQSKIGSGATYFAALLLILLSLTVGGLQLLATLARWRDYGVLQAVGFSSPQILLFYGGQLLLLLMAAILFAGAAVRFWPLLASSRETFTNATLLAIGATLASVLPALLWPLRLSPAAMLKELQ